MKFESKRVDDWQGGANILIHAFRALWTQKANNNNKNAVVIELRLSLGLGVGAGTPSLVSPLGRVLALCNFVPWGCGLNLGEL